VVSPLYPLILLPRSLKGPKTSKGKLPISSFVDFVDNKQKTPSSRHFEVFSFSSLEGPLLPVLRSSSHSPHSEAPLFLIATHPPFRHCEAQSAEAISGFPRQTIKPPDPVPLRQARLLRSARNDDTCVGRLLLFFSVESSVSPRCEFFFFSPSRDLLLFSIRSLFVFWSLQGLPIFARHSHISSLAAPSSSCHCEALSPFSSLRDTPFTSSPSTPLLIVVRHPFFSSL